MLGASQNLSILGSELGPNETGEVRLGPRDLTISNKEQTPLDLATVALRAVPMDPPASADAGHGSDSGFSDSVSLLEGWKGKVRGDQFASGMNNDIFTASTQSPPTPPVAQGTTAGAHPVTGVGGDGKGIVAPRTSFGAAGTGGTASSTAPAAPASALGGTITQQAVTDSANNLRSTSGPRHADPTNPYGMVFTHEVLDQLWRVKVGGTDYMSTGNNYEAGAYPPVSLLA